MGRSPIDLPSRRNPLPGVTKARTVMELVLMQNMMVPEIPECVGAGVTMLVEDDVDVQRPVSHSKEGDGCGLDVDTVTSTAEYTCTVDKPEPVTRNLDMNTRGIGENNEDESESLGRGTQQTEAETS